MKVTLEKTNRGNPALWECGGGMTTYAARPTRIIANGDGTKPTAIAMRRHSNANHALVPVEPGMYILEASGHRGDPDILILRIQSIEKDENGGWVAITESMESYKDGEWDDEPPPFLHAAISALRLKANDYHCRKAYWAEQKAGRNGYSQVVEKIVVTRHAGLVDYLIQEGYVGENTPVLAHASPEDVQGKHVFGVLPLDLAAHAALVTTVTVNRALDERINPTELTADDLRERGVTVATYKVEYICSPKGAEAAGANG